jgi:hypothetical protein
MERGRFPTAPLDTLFLVSGDPYVFGLKALGAFHDVEYDGLAFLEAAEASL